MANLAISSVTLVFMRQVQDEGDFLVANSILAYRLTRSNRGYVNVAPLWFKAQGNETRTLPNIAPSFAASVAASTGLVHDNCVEGPKQGGLGGIL